MAVPRSRSEGGPLKAFRLSDVPLDLRTRAARYLARTLCTPPDVTPAERLLARVADVRAGGYVDEAEQFRRAAERPSEKVYFVSMRAWEQVMSP